MEKSPAEILGKRDESTVDAVNYILNLQGSGTGITAYDDEIKAALEKSPSEILG